MDQKSAKYKHFHSTIIEPLALTQIITKPTRITATTNTLLDLIMTSVPENAMGQGATEIPGISDHHMVYMSYAIKKPKQITKKIRVRDMKQFDEKVFLDDCDRAPWHLTEIFNEEDIENKVTVLENITLDLINKHAPYKEIIVKENGPKWLNKNIRKAMDKRDKLKTHCNTTKDLED